MYIRAFGGNKDAFIKSCSFSVHGRCSASCLSYLPPPLLFLHAALKISMVYDIPYPGLHSPPLLLPLYGARDG